ncbi:hypothetical protein EDC04DRAFT_2937985 [Pisolithus marmoratus]|nr:hypothetical protein EDC04DRAFT_2937985 [Pisolithus marmoratus]
MSDGNPALKHRCNALEEENHRLRAKLTKTLIHSYRVEGRAICWLADLVNPLSDLITEHDHRLDLGAEDEASADDIQSSAEEDYAYCSFKRLIHWCPSIKKLLNGEVDDHDVSLAFRDLKMGADGARSDDTSRLKSAVATWLNNTKQRLEPLLIPDNKLNQGFYHDATGQLLCPVDYDWLDPFQWQPLIIPSNCKHVSHFFIYEGHYDSKNPSKGLFRGDYLLKAFCCIFTSPSSAEEKPNTNEVGSRPTKRIKLRPHRNVAQLLGMKAVDPRAIAYIACQLHFTLSSSTSWDLNDEVFDYNIFYWNIVDYFEWPSSPRKSAEIQELLLWWNSCILVQMPEERKGSQHHDTTEVPNSIIELWHAAPDW